MILRFQSSWQVKKKCENILLISSAFKKKSYEVKSNNPAIFSFLDILKEGIKYPEDLSRFAEELGLAESSLNSITLKFKSLEILIEDEKVRHATLETAYDRQIRFFRTFENKTSSGELFNENLQNKTVLIVGLGGYGSWTAILCARIGIRNIVGIDFDNVEITNLHRQILYDRVDLGKPKIEACEKKIKEADPAINFMGHFVKVTTPEDLYPFVDNVDLVFNPFSYLPSKRALSHPAGIVAKAAMDKNKPCLTFGGSWIGPLTIPHQTPCYFCAIRKLELTTDLDPECRNPNIQKRAFAPPIATCCSIAVYEASRFLSACDDSQVLKGIIQLDMLSFSNSQFLPLDYAVDCDFCNSSEHYNLEVIS